MDVCPEWVSRLPNGRVSWRRLNGKEACSVGRGVSGALDSDVGHRAVLPPTCVLFGYMACMLVTQRRQRIVEEPLVGQGGQKRAFHKRMIVH